MCVLLLNWGDRVVLFWTSMFTADQRAVIGMTSQLWGVLPCEWVHIPGQSQQESRHVTDCHVSVDAMST